MRKTVGMVLVIALAVASVAVLPGCSSSTTDEVAAVKFVQFYDPDCPFCQAMEPIVEKMRQEYESKIQSFEIIDVSTDEGMAKAEEFGVFITPTFFMLDANDQTLDKISGATTEENMVKFIERAIADSKGESTGPKDVIPTEGGTQQDFSGE